MSSKTGRNKKDTTPVSVQDESSSNQSQLSPTRYSRLNEKKELANLNDRLACYIDRVRTLEIENSRLTREVRTSQETISKEITSVKTVYENELKDTRLLLDELSREKTKLEIDAGHLVEENEELKENLMKKINEFNSLQNSYSITENHLAELSNKYNLANQDRLKLRELNKTLEEEKNKYASVVSKLQKSLDEEIVSRVSLQNSIKSIREDFAFKEQILQKQLTECRNKVEVTEVDGQLPQVYEERFYESLQEIREQYEIDLENNKKEIKKLYEEKLRSLESQLIQNSNTSSFALNEMKQMQLKIDETNKRLAEAEEERNIANQKARDLMREFESLKREHMNEIAKHNLEMTRLNEEMTYQVQKYEELMDEKVALDLEIAAYGKLLEGEETRLNITPLTNLSNRSGVRSAKRKRACFENNDVSTSSSFCVKNSAKGDIEFSEIDVEGKFIRLDNKGNNEVSLSGWHIVQTVGGIASSSFKFGRSFKINPGGSVTVWSADSEQAHKPPENILMKHKKWLVADNMSISLINDSGEEVASSKHVKQKTSSTIHRERKKLEVNGETNVGEERCSIM